ncbi:VOC family protein [Nguyenibacter vanlangensis]|uniref:VOC family protein n=1 Tax=Nguyenibacter vanlangensis TaxID=1216886 RepID=A0A7Y7IYL7_9PROT|nr:VOC family protein [Nguyenibacter vanlangensis]NVN12165.1 VOC family protein [Nguyenibacter vanlangensis]
MRKSVAAGFSISVSADTTEEAERIFTTLSDGATVTMPLQKTFWAPIFGTLTDRYGVAWMVGCES